MPEDERLKRLIAQHTKPPRQHTETTLLGRLQKRMMRFGGRLWRNQVGTYKLADGRYVTSGLCVGSSDLIGYVPVVVTPAMVGTTLAVFVAIEAKSVAGRATPTQLAFVADVVRAGGRAGVVRAEAELGAVLA